LRVFIDLKTPLFNGKPLNTRKYLKFQNICWNPNKNLFKKHIPDLTAKTFKDSQISREMGSEG